MLNRPSGIARFPLWAAKCAQGTWEAGSGQSEHLPID